MSLRPCAVPALVPLLLAAACAAPAGTASAGDTSDSAAAADAVTDAGTVDSAAAPVDTGFPSSDVPSNPDACAGPGATGNDGGVGEYCTPKGGQCKDNSSALICTVDFTKTAPPFCTIYCETDADCGPQAVCQGEKEGTQKGCTPKCLIK